MSEVPDEVTRAVVDALPAELVQVDPAVLIWLDPSGLVVYLNGTTLRCGRGLRNHVISKPRAVRAIADFNQSADLGHLWLCDAGPGQRWTLVWCCEIELRWLPPTSVRGVVRDTVHDARELLPRLGPHILDEVGGQDYWDRFLKDAGGPLIPSLALISQIG